MFSFQCNIDKNDRINRIVIGVLILLAVLFHMSQTFLMALGAVLVIEGLIGWCSIPFFIKKIKDFK